MNAADQLAQIEARMNREVPALDVHDRSDLRGAVAVLRAVLDRHADDGEGFCRCCEFVWPCWTVREIEEALR